MKKVKEDKFELKDSYFDGFEYKGYHVRTNLVIEGQNEYKPLKFSNPAEVYNAFKKLRISDKERFYSVLLDAKNKVIGVEMVSQGSLEGAPVHPEKCINPPSSPRRLRLFSFTRIRRAILNLLFPTGR